MFQRILVPIDGSERSERAISVAARIACASDGTIVLLSATLSPTGFGRDEAVRAAKSRLDSFPKHEETVIGSLKKITSTYAEDLAGIKTEMDLAAEAAPEIDTVARQQNVDLIVLSSHGETGSQHRATGSVVQHAVRHTSVPVLVLQEYGIPPEKGDAFHPLRMLVPVDGSALSEAVLAPAAQLLQILSPSAGEIHLFHVVHVPSAYGKMKGRDRVTDVMQDDFREQAERYGKSLISWCRATFKAFDFQFTFSLAISTNVADAILREVEQTGDTKNGPCYDLIAMTTHGRGGLKRLMMGSVTEQVLGATTHPLLVIRPQKAQIKEDTSDEAEQAPGTNAGV